MLRAPHRFSIAQSANNPHVPGPHRRCFGQPEQSPALLVRPSKQVLDNGSVLTGLGLRAILRLLQPLALGWLCFPYRGLMVQ